MFDNDDPEQRASLIQALHSVGLDAWDLNSGGGVMHVIVTLLDGTVDPPVISAQAPKLRADLENALRTWPCDSALYIATNSLQSECDIGLMGTDGRTDAQVATSEWKHTDSLEEAVRAFQQLWAKRDSWLKKFIEGKLEA